MQQSTNANIEQRFGRAVEEVRSIIDEHEELCSEQVAAAEAKAQGDINRFEEVCEELARGRRELSALAKSGSGFRSRRIGRVWAAIPPLSAS
ncbi:MAG: hypothetical protein M3R38_23840 [Actinomycetota bacterium]|nr:hypothetical protein [Actinomycetota bacterium]